MADEAEAVVSGSASANPFGEVPGEVLQQIISFLPVSVLGLKRLMLTCQQWRQAIKAGFDLRIIIVIVAGSNEVVFLSASPPPSGQSVIHRFLAKRPPKRKRRTIESERSNWYQNHDHCWPTFVGLGPEKQLYVCQRKVAGVLEYKYSPQGYKYRRMLQAGIRLARAEGVVVAHDSLYVLSALHRTVTRLALDSHKVLESAGPQEEQLRHNPEWNLWGMCISPDKRTLLIAAHMGDGCCLLQPTKENTGVIVRLDLEEGGSFTKAEGSDTPLGYYSQQLPTTLQLNRPCSPQFCSHDMLHVSSFEAGERGQRRIHKLAFDGYDQVPTHHGWLKQDQEQQQGLPRLDPFGISFSQSGEEVFVTCTALSSVAKFDKCGCDEVLGQGSHRGLPQEIACGQATSLSGDEAFDRPISIVTME